MPVDYSKWDALELSDDSDIEVHPNVDKRSFIRAKQNQIHIERERRKHQIATLKYERIINDTLMRRISGLLDCLKAHAADAAAGGRNQGEVAFAAVMESAARMKPGDDEPPPRPAGVHENEEKLPTFTKMLATLLDKVNKALDDKKVPQEERYEAMVKEIGHHLDEVQKLQKELQEKLDELEKEEHSKITSEDIHTGFDSSYVNKSKTPGSSGSPGSASRQESKVELLNPNYDAAKEEEKAKAALDDDDELEASPEAKDFAKISADDYRASMSFLSSHPEILTEKESDGILVMAFDAQLRNQDDVARQCVHQALLLQYCRALGRDGVALFFKRIMTQGHKARDVFFKDVQDSYMKIKTRAREINAQRVNGDASEGVEQIQLKAIEPGTVINIRVPPLDSQDPAEQEARKIFDGFKPEMKKALESGSLDKVNEVLGRMKVDEAEDLVGKFGDANILSMEEQIIDATTEEGKAQWKQMEQQAAATTSESQYADDPE